MISKKPIYGNHTVLGPDGNILFCVGDKKVNWYLKKGLVEVVSKEPSIVKLLFQPNGPGRYGDEYYLSKKENRCVVCGSEVNLNRHHVVPYCYRKYMHEVVKRYNSYDIVPLCISCHDEYERYADQLKTHFATKHKIPLAGKGRVYHKDLERAVGAAKSILKHGITIPSHRLDALYEKVENYLGHKPTQDEVEVLSQTARSKIHYESEEFIAHGNFVIKQFEDLDEFFILWRKHFVETMKPQFLPQAWKIERRVVAEQMKRKPYNRGVYND